MKVLFVDSGFHSYAMRYAHDIYTALNEDFGCEVLQVNPHHLSERIIHDFKPDLFLVVHGTYTPLHLVHQARSAGITTVLWLVEDPYEIDTHRGSMVNAYDFVFTNEKEAVKEYQHSRVYYLPWCCNPKIHRRTAVADHFRSDLCMVGMGFRNRIQILNAIAPLLSRLNIKLIGDWQNWGEELHPDLRRFVMPVINDFMEVLKYYNGAAINLNIHRDPTDPPAGNRERVRAISPNDRTFILAGCGAFQIVDQTRPELWNCLALNSEIVGFSDPNELAAKIEEYLSKPEARENIGLAAQQRAYREHTYRHRLTEIFRKLGWQ